MWWTFWTHFYKYPLYFSIPSIKTYINWLSTCQLDCQLCQLSYPQTILGNHPLLVNRLVIIIHTVIEPSMCQLRLSVCVHELSICVIVNNMFSQLLLESCFSYPFSVYFICKQAGILNNCAENITWISPVTMAVVADIGL